MNARRAGARVRGVIRSIQPDVIVPGVFPASWWTLGHDLGVPQVWMAHDPGGLLFDRRYRRSLTTGWRIAIAMAGGFFRSMDRTRVRTADAVLANSRFTRKAIQAHYAVRATVCYPGVDARFFVPSGPKRRVVFAAGLWTAFKRLIPLIDAFHELCESEPEIGWQLRIAGVGPTVREAKHRVEELGLKSNVHFLGLITREELLREYQQATVCALPTQGEAFGLVPLEAMAAGTPVVAYNDGGPAETIEHGVTGYLAESDQEFARLLCLAGKDPALGFRAREGVETEWAWSVRAESLVKQLQAAVDGLRASLGPPGPHSVKSE